MYGHASMRRELFTHIHAYARRSDALPGARCERWRATPPRRAAAVIFGFMLGLCVGVPVASAALRFDDVGPTSFKRAAHRVRDLPFALSPVLNEY